jgi:hypothetical protein
MNKVFVASFLLLFLLLSNFAFAASSAAALQVTGYSVAPTKAYPGTKGYIQLQIENSGTDTASGLKVDYSSNFNYNLVSVYPGDIAAGANSQVSIPFEIPYEISTGMVLYKIEIYYLASENGGSSKSTTFSVPIVVSQSEILQVNTLSAGGGTLSPGDKVTVLLEIKNTGGTINDLTISTPSNSSFSIGGSTRKTVGSISSNSSVNVSLELVSSSLASIGQYLLPLTFTYMDALQNPATQTLYAGPVTVLDPSSQIRVRLEPTSSTEIGSAAEFNIIIENGGTSATSAIVEVDSTSAFTPIGSSKLYIPSIEPGKTASGKVTIGISASIESGYYELPLNVTLGTGKTFLQSVGVHVEATPELKISGEMSTSTTGSEIVIQISNTGNTPIRSVYAVAEMGGTKVEKFIGTLNIDDYSTLSIPLTTFDTSTTGMPARNASAGVMPQNRTAQGGAVKVTITFKDEQNQPHTVKQDVSISSGGTRQTTGTFPQRTTNSGVIFGLSALQLGGIGVVIAIAAYLVYRKKFRKHASEE